MFKARCSIIAKLIIVKHVIHWKHDVPFLQKTRYSIIAKYIEKNRCLIIAKHDVQLLQKHNIQLL